MKLRLYNTICICLIGYVAFAQEEPKPFRNVLSVNVTSLLGEVISVGDNKNSDKFNILYSRLGTGTNLRIGANIFFKKSSENNDVIGSGTTELKEQDYKFRIGMDWKYDLSRKFNFTAGLDALYQYNGSLSTSSTIFVNEIKTNSFGLGPVLRFEYRISNRIGFMTESSLYLIFGHETDVLKENGVTILSSDSNTININTVIPSVLYINVYF